MQSAADGHSFALRERGGHRARLLGTVDEAYAQMQRLIDAAVSSIRFECYIVRAEGPAAALRAALLRARSRGVSVDVLLDAFGCEDLPADYFSELEAAGGRVRRFNPLRLLRLSFRNHRKLLACDGCAAVVGGFNIGPEYSGDGVTGGWCDLGMFIEGPVVRELEDSFDAMVQLAPFTPAAIADFRLAASRWNQGARSADAAPVQLLVSGPPLSRGRLRRQLRVDLAAAKQVAIVSGYFLPPWNVRRSLRRCVQQGGQVELLLAGRSDVGLARLAAERLYPWLLRQGVSIREYRPRILHAKLLVMDDIVHTGSCNLDRRSLHINFELLLRLDWPELAGDARQWCERAFARSRRVRLAAFRRRRGYWRRVASRLAYELLAHVDPLVARRRFRALG
ncbi:MAG: phosphatidylserine/phosphatidylglycerophosphate/cardiolipin synthase family protein [Steroidobacteraceae bacterium]